MAASSSKTEKIEKMILEGIPAKDIAKALDVPGYAVYNQRFKLKKRGLLEASAKLASKPAEEGVVTPNACIGVTIDPDHIIAIKVRCPDLQGTLYVSKDGVAYSRPNAKLKPTEFLGFGQLAKLVDSGLFHG